MTEPAPAPPPGSLFDAQGRARVVRRGLPRVGVFRDLYHALRTTSWARLIAILAAFYVGANLTFASVLWATGATIVNAVPGSFADCFWFSVQTLATIGYGTFAPGDTIAHLVVTVESFFGIALSAMVTGIFFAKFATPVARVMFSKQVLIADEEGVPTLTFRMANARDTLIMEANIKVSLLCDEQLSSGRFMRRIYDLPLRRSTTPSFVISWVVFSPIGPGSPLEGLTLDELGRRNAMFLVTFTGIDDRLATTVHTRYEYTFRDVVFDHRFADILHTDPETGGRVVDYAHFDELEPLLPQPAQAIELPAAAG